MGLLLGKLALKMMSESACAAVAQSESSDAKNIKLQSNDGVTFSMSTKEAMRLKTIRDMLDALQDENASEEEETAVPLPNVT